MANTKEELSPAELVADLSAKLRTFDQLFEEARRAGDWEGCVWGYAGVLALLKTTLKQLPGFDADMLPLTDLMLRLNELALGNATMPPPKRGKGGRPPEGQRAAIIQGRSVAALEILIARGLRAEPASEFIAKNLRKFGVLGRQGKPVTADTVRDWRVKVTDNTAFCEKKEARDLYREALRTWAEFAPPGMPLSKVKELLGNLVAPSESATGRLLANPHLSG